MNNKLTEMIFVLDRSGSMSGLESDTIGGYNGLLAKQKKVEGEAVVTTVLFDSEHTTIHDRVKLSEVKPLTAKDYQTGGCTALMDALGDTLEKISHLQQHLREEDKPGKTVVCIITDGLENASTHYRKKDIKTMISNLTEKNGWEFIFMGANIDAAEEAESYGIHRDRAVEYCCNSEGVSENFLAMDAVMCCARADFGPRKSKHSIDGVLQELREKHKSKK